MPASLTCLGLGERIQILRNISFSAIEAFDPVHRILFRRTMLIAAEQVAPLPTGDILLWLLCLLRQLCVYAGLRESSAIIVPSIRIQRAKLVLILVAVVLIITS